VIRWWASHVSSRSVSGRPGTCTRARTDLPPRKETGRLTTSHSPVSVGLAVSDLELHR
jgi:hypothetical protein